MRFCPLWNCIFPLFLRVRKFSLYLNLMATLSLVWMNLGKTIPTKAGWVKNFSDFLHYELHYFMCTNFPLPHFCSLCRGIQTQHWVQPCHPIWSQVNLSLCIVSHVKLLIILSISILMFITETILFNACHSCHHELETARINGLLGNIDANTGDPQVGMCKFSIM